MRHNVHILLGPDLKRFVARLGKYVIKYGESGVSDYYRCLTWEKDESGAIEIKRVQLDQNVKAGFVSTTKDCYATKLEHDSHLPAESQQVQLQHYFTALHQSTVTIHNQGDSNSLLLVLYLPLYDSALCQQAKDIIDVLGTITSRYNVMIVGLCADLQYMLSPENYNNVTPDEQAVLYQSEKNNLHRLCELQLAQNALEQFVVIQNVNAAGYALNLDEESLIRIFGELSLLCLEKYNTIFSQTSAFDRKHPITSLGLSVLNLDKYYFANYLLRKSYLHILSREDVSAETVDVNKVAVVANDHLLGHKKLFSNFYNKEIVPLLRQGMSQSQIIAQTSSKLEAKMESVYKHLVDYVSDPDLTLPEKKALLAMILGYDDPLLHGNLFNQDQLTLDSLDEEAANVFIEANNSFVKVTESDDGTKTYSGSILLDCIGEDGMVELPLKQLQQLRNKIRESTNYIRQKYQELEDIEQMTEDSIESEHVLTENGFVIDGVLYRLDVAHNEVKFDETYTPKKVTEKNVDLRGDFTPIKNQGQIGACTVFTVASIFEYILKKNSQTICDLSEAFVYYNVRHCEGKEHEDTGSSYKDVIHSIGELGICSESLHPYSKAISDAPSQEAFADALKRKIVKALNVNVDEDNIKSAIQEGYPVAISLKVFESFKTVDGFISYPSDNELASGDFGYHAMVVCGYSDESRLFVVRNSWGEGFGDKGYCYIPYSYICDSDLNRMACIITEVDTSGESAKTIVVGRGNKGRIVQFNMSDASIKSRVIKNLLDEEERNLKEMQKEDVNLRHSYEKLMQSLGRQSVRNEILTTCQEHLKACIKDAKTKQHDINSQERPEALQVFDKSTWRNRIILIIANVVLFLTWIALCVCYANSEDVSTALEGLWEWLESTWCIIHSSLLIICVCVAILYWWYIRTQRRRLEMDLENRSSAQAMLAKKLTDELVEKQLKFHVAGMVIDNLLNLKTTLDSKYQSMKSYVSNLSMWQKEETEAVNSMEPLIKNPFIPLLDNDTLERYFEGHKDYITDQMHLYDYYKKYTLNDDAIANYKLELKNSILQNIFKLLEDFSIFRHIFNVKAYPYLDSKYASAENLLPLLDSKSEPFCQIRSSASIMPQARFLFINTDAEEKNAWNREYPQHFTSTPISENIMSVYKIVELRLQLLSEEEILLKK